MSAGAVPYYLQPQVQRAVARRVLAVSEKNAEMAGKIVRREPGTEKLKLRLDGIPEALAAMRERQSAAR
jgi:hypothetical protein